MLTSLPSCNFFIEIFQARCLPQMKFYLLTFNKSSFCLSKRRKYVRKTCCLLVLKKKLKSHTLFLYWQARISWSVKQEWEVWKDEEQGWNTSFPNIYNMIVLWLKKSLLKIVITKIIHRYAMPVLFYLCLYFSLCPYIPNTQPLPLLCTNPSACAVRWWV